MNKVIGAILLASGMFIAIFAYAGGGMTKGVTLSGNMLKAGSLAYSDFSKHLEGEFKDNSTLARFFGHIANYDVRIDEMEKIIIIEFVPKAKAGRNLKGGGAEYKVLKESFTIKDRLLFR